MKKLIAILLLIALVISCCACGKQPAEETPAVSVPDYDEVVAAYEAEKLEGQATPEEMYGMIDEMTPIDGVYKIWSAKGVQNMADHPDADFEFLCSIDMEGATLRPIGSKEKPFTGTINGLNNILSNFTISESNGGYMGFIGYNQGTISDIKLEGVTMVADANTQYIGGLAGYSEKNLRSVTVNGTMLVENAAEGAVCGAMAGYICANVVNSNSDVDITYTAAGSATIGGCVGVADGMHAEFSENYGALVVSGSNKTVGLFAGQAKDVDLYNVAFLGEKNEVEGKLCTEYFGQVENQTIEAVYVRDNTPNPLPEKQQAVRDTVVDAMYAMATVQWTTTQDLYHDCHCLLAVCHGAYKGGQLHIGIPYNHYSTTLNRFMACFDENNVGKEWLYDMPSIEGFDTYFGNDCSGAVQAAWWTVSTTTDVQYCENMQPIRAEYGCIPVGEWPSDVEVATGEDSKDVVTALADMNVWYEAYAQVRHGDAYVHIGKDGNHTRMAQEDAVVVRDENGLINGDYSYIITVEQGAPATMDPYFCSWRYDYKYSFKNLVMGGYLPVTCIELVTGETDPIDCKLVGGIEGRGGMTVGEIQSNYNIDTVTLQIVDSQGDVAFDHTLNPNAMYRSDFGCTDMGIRNVAKNFHLSKFATPLSYADLELGESYTYTISTLLSTGDVIVLTEGNFTNGSAA